MRIKRLRNVLATCVFVTLIYMLYVPHVFDTNFLETVIKLAKSPEYERSIFIKYVLIWTSPRADPIFWLGKGNDTFYKSNCSYKNCYVTSKRRLIKFSYFDAIIFHGPEIMGKWPDNYFPIERSANQSYIFASMESSHNYNVPDNRYDGEFNFTWTYKLNSDVNYGYIIIRDIEGNVLGPNAAIPWIGVDDMSPIKDSVKTKLAKKSIAAAWFVSNCGSYSERETVAKMLISELDKYNMTVDVYGGCGNKRCPRKFMDKCLKKIQRDYYFYFAFENSLSDDYVTEKLLIPLQNYAVPIVYGAANYERFMPNGIYLKVTNNNKSVAEVVNQMVGSIKYKNRYYEFFKWHNHYSYHKPTDAPDTDPYCSLCSFINNIDHSKVSVVENFQTWWKPA